MNELETCLASRWKRLWGALLDGFIGLTLMAPLIMVFGMWRTEDAQISLISKQRIMANLLGWGVFLVLNIYLLKNHGQTVGKKIVGTRIVSKEDGQIMTLGHILFYRYLLMSIMAYIPILYKYFPIVDVLFIFRKDKRCIHDIVAGTVVVNSKPPMPKYIQSPLDPSMDK